MPREVTILDDENLEDDEAPRRDTNLHAALGNMVVGPRRAHVKTCEREPGCGGSREHASAANNAPLAGHSWITS